MRCLFWASWWPTDESPVAGIFIKEHGQAAALFTKVVAVHFKPAKRVMNFRNFPFSVQVDFKSEEGIDTYLVSIHMAIRRFGFYRYAVKKAIEKILQQLHKKYSFDLININILRTEFAELLVEENFLPGLPIVVTENSSFYYSEINLLNEQEKKAKKNQLTRLLNSSRIKKIISVSHHLAQTFTNTYKVNPQRIAIVPNIGADTFFYKPSPHADNITRIVMAAQWSYPKNPFAFLHVLSKMPADKLRLLKVDWFGDGPQMAEIKELAAKVKQPVITFHGYGSKTQIADYLREADFLLHPTDKENLPCIVIESLCCGTPVLSNNVSGVTELLDKSNGIMVAINNETELESALDFMSQKKQFDRRKISEEARKKFSKEAVGEKIFCVYKEAVEAISTNKDYSHAPAEAK